MTAQNPDPTDLPSLIGRVVRELRGLVSAEIALAKHEMSENVSKAGVGLVLIGIAVIIALCAVSALAVAAIFGLASFGIAYGWAALITGVAFLVIATIFALLGKSRLSPGALAPNRTLKRVKTDFSITKEATHV